MPKNLLGSEARCSRFLMPQRLELDAIPGLTVKKPQTGVQTCIRAIVCT
ncbi:MAG: hypothetical protein R3Y54_13070 [Eubacteriales bacterium]